MGSAKTNIGHLEGGAARDLGFRLCSAGVWNEKSHRLPGRGDGRHSEMHSSVRVARFSERADQPGMTCD